MHTIDHPSTTQYYIALNNGEVSSYGYVEPSQRLDSGAQAFETFTTEAAMQARLTQLGVVLQNMELDMDASPELQRLVLKAKINILRMQKMYEPISFNGEIYDADAFARENLGEAVDWMQLGVSVGVWRTFDNKTIPFSDQDLMGLANAFAIRKVGCMQTSWALKAAVDAATDPTTVDIQIGWPT
jgi:hypothetical protein